LGWAFLFSAPKLTLEPAFKISSSLPNNLNVEVIKMVTVVLSLVANLSAAMLLASYVGLLWHHRSRQELPTWVVVLFLVGAGGVLLSVVSIYILHYLLGVI
jgi:hypothetical protein